MASKPDFKTHHLIKSAAASAGYGLVLYQLAGIMPSPYTLIPLAFAVVDVMLPNSITSLPILGYLGKQESGMLVIGALSAYFLQGVGLQLALMAGAGAAAGYYLAAMALKPSAS